MENKVTFSPHCVFCGQEVRMEKTPHVLDPAAVTKIIGICENDGWIIAVAEDNSILNWQALARNSI